MGCIKYDINDWWLGPTLVGPKSTYDVIEFLTWSNQWWAQNKLMMTAIIGLGHTKIGPQTFYETSIIGSVQPELGLKVSMMTWRP
jgi:hypothetical protein